MWPLRRASRSKSDSAAPLSPIASTIPALRIVSAVVGDPAPFLLARSFLVRDFIRISLHLRRGGLFWWMSLHQARPGKRKCLRLQSEVFLFLLRVILHVIASGNVW